MTERHPELELQALMDLALADLNATNDADLRREALERGAELDVEAERGKSMMRAAAAKVLRERLEAARAEMPARAKPAFALRISVEDMKAAVKRAFSAKQGLGLAFRGRRSSSDKDWASLYEDLVSLGEIKPEEDVD